jgi:hypothetical protein
MALLAIWVCYRAGLSSLRWISDGDRGDEIYSVAEGDSTIISGKKFRVLKKIRPVFLKKNFRKDPEKIRKCKKISGFSH